MRRITNSDTYTIFIIFVLSHRTDMVRETWADFLRMWLYYQVFLREYTVKPCLRGAQTKPSAIFVRNCKKMIVLRRDFYIAAGIITLIKRKKPFKYA